AVVRSATLGSRRTRLFQARTNGCILVLGDEWLVRGLVARTLMRAGYEVITATTSRDAVESAQSYAGEIPLFITNYSPLDGKTGGVVAETIGEMRPKTQVLYILGDAEVAPRNPRTRSPGSSYLKVPFWPKQIIDTVKGILDG